MVPLGPFQRRIKTNLWFSERKKKKKIVSAFFSVSPTSHRGMLGKSYAINMEYQRVTTFFLFRIKKKVFLVNICSRDSCLTKNFFFLFSQNQRLVLVRLLKVHKRTICWEGQVVVSKTHTAGSIMGISYQILRREANIWAKVGMGQWSWSEVRSRVQKGDSIYMN